MGRDGAAREMAMVISLQMCRYQHMVPARQKKTVKNNTPTHAQTPPLPHRTIYDADDDDTDDNGDDIAPIMPLAMTDGDGHSFPFASSPSQRKQGQGSPSRGKQSPTKKKKHKHKHEKHTTYTEHILLTEF